MNVNYTLELLNSIDDLQIAHVFAEMDTMFAMSDLYQKSIMISEYGSDSELVQESCFFQEGKVGDFFKNAKDNIVKFFKWCGGMLAKLARKIRNFFRKLFGKEPLPDKNTNTTTAKSSDPNANANAKGQKLNMDFSEVEKKQEEVKAAQEELDKQREEFNNNHNARMDELHHAYVNIKNGGKVEKGDVITSPVDVKRAKAWLRHAMQFCKDIRTIPDPLNMDQFEKHTDNIIQKFINNTANAEAIFILAKVPLDDDVFDAISELPGTMNYVADFLTTELPNNTENMISESDLDEMLKHNNGMDKKQIEMKFIEVMKKIVNVSKGIVNTANRITQGILIIMPKFREAGFTIRT